MTHLSRLRPTLKSVLRWRRSILALWVLLCALVVFGSLSPTIGPPGGNGMDKLVHLGAYALLTLLPALALRRNRMAVALGILAVSLVLEVVQHAMGLGRSGSIGDAFANGLGVAAGAALAHWLRHALGRAA